MPAHWEKSRRFRALKPEFTFCSVPAPAGRRPVKCPRGGWAFGFSAGLFDYVLNYSLATRPWLLIPVGLAYFGLYYGLFRFFIVRFNLKTLGRETDEAAPRAEPAGGSAPAYAWINALGSASNLHSVEACATRLRLVVADSGRIDERELKALGAHGVLRLADGALQVVVGPIADQLASEIRSQLRVPAARAPAVAVSMADESAARQAVKAMGGATNIRDLQGNATRLLITVADPTAVDEASLRRLVRAVSQPAPGSVHLVVGPAAAGWLAQIRAFVP